ncbi:MAG: hypothetical protein AAGH99_13915 [Planctomycetota bacterium]
MACLPSRLRQVDLPSEQLKYIDRVARGVTNRFWERRRILDDLLIEFQTCAAAGGEPPYPLADRKARKSLTRRYRQESIKKRHPVDRAIGRGIRWTTRMLFVVVLLSMPCFYFSEPKLETNHLAAINARATALAEEDRAWPKYRDVLLALPPTEIEGNDLLWYGMRKQDPLWPQMQEYLTENERQLQAIRAAAEMPGLGLALGYFGQQTGLDAEVLGQEPLNPAFTTPSYDQLTMPIWAHLDLSYLGAVRRLANLILADARFAAEQGDINRLLSNIETLQRMSQHVAEPGVAMSQLVSMSFRAQAYSVILDTLQTSPNLLKAESLVALQTLINNTPPPDIDIDLMFIESDDYIQRSYHARRIGPELVTPNGLAMLGFGDDERTYAPLSRTRRAALSLFAPLLWTALPTRSSAERRLETLKQLVQDDLQVSWWEQPYSAYEKSLRESGRFDRLRYFWEIFSAPWPRIRLALIQHTTLRDGTLVTIASYRYQRDNGTWPINLGGLSPDYLDTIPKDPVTGNSLRYTVRGDKPVVYSVGADSDDDGGNWPMIENTDWRWDKDSAEPETPIMEPDNDAAMRLDVENPLDGDWILFPVPPEPPAELPDLNDDSYQ